MGLDLDAPVAPELRAEEVLLRREDVLVVHAEPLERRVRLGDERGDADVDARGRSEDRPAELDGVADQPDDAGQVLVGLRGQADHEVELDEPPAALEGEGQGVPDLAVVELLVDDGPETVGPRFGHEGETGLADLEDVPDELPRQPPRPERREGERDLLPVELVHETADDLLELRVVADRQGRERGVLVARLPEAADRRAVDEAGVLRPVGEVQARGLAETAILGTSPGGFDGHPVEHDAQAGNDDLLRERTTGKNPRPGAWARPRERRRAAGARPGASRRGRRPRRATGRRLRRSWPARAAGRGAARRAGGGPRRPGRSPGSPPPRRRGRRGRRSRRPVRD